jgi:hypothetical protein
LPCAISSVVCEKIPENLEVLRIIPEIVVRGIWNHDRMTERGRDRGAFGRGKRVICMDGLDLYDLLDLAITLEQALDLKVRRAGETGLPFLRIRDLFPK